MLFSEGDGSDLLYTVVSGRVKVFKTTARGTDVILEIFGPGDPVGAVAVYEARPYPASALALEPTTCLLIPRQAFFSLLETYPTMVRGLLVGLTHRLVELTNRLAELSGGRVEGRLARFFLKLAHDMGQTRDDGTFIAAGAVAPGAGGHDRHDDRDVDPHHEPLGKAGHRPDGEGRVRRRRSRRARDGRVVVGGHPLFSSFTPYDAGHRWVLTPARCWRHAIGRHCGENPTGAPTPPNGPC